MLCSFRCLVVVKEAGRCVRGTGFALNAPQSPPTYIKKEYFKSVRCGGRNRRAAMLSLALILLAQMSFRKKYAVSQRKSGDCPQLVLRICRRRMSSLSRVCRPPLLRRRASQTSRAHALLLLLLVSCLSPYRGSGGNIPLSLL